MSGACVTYGDDEKRAENFSQKIRKKRSTF